MAQAGDDRLAGKVAIVTGAGSRGDGIGNGRATAVLLARHGAKVTVLDQVAEWAERTAGMIRDEGGTCQVVLADVTKPADLERLVQAAIDRYGGIDVLITNAGGPPAGTFDKFNDADWQAAFELTLMSAVRLIRLALPSMRARGGGVIIAMTSSSIKQPIPNLLLSNVMRAGVAGLAKTLADELAPDGIRVNTIVPGRIATPRVAQLDRVNAERQGVDVAVIEQRETSRIPMGRYGTPEEFADAVAFLASERASYITGATLQVDGGMIRSLW